MPIAVFFVILCLLLFAAVIWLYCWYWRILRYSVLAVVCDYYLMVFLVLTLGYSVSVIVCCYYLSYCLYWRILRYSVFFIVILCWCWYWRILRYLVPVFLFYCSMPPSTSGLAIVKTRLMNGTIFDQSQETFLARTLIGSYAHTWNNQRLMTSQCVTGMNKSEPELGYVTADWSKMIPSKLRVLKWASLEFYEALFFTIDWRSSFFFFILFIVYLSLPFLICYNCFYHCTMSFCSSVLNPLYAHFLCYFFQRAFIISLLIFLL